MLEGISLRELRVFLALAEELHFGRAAQRLGLTQSRVSQSLRDLERRLGGRLVHRTSRRVSLTPAGERFRRELAPALEQLTSVLQRAAISERAPAGTLRIGLLNAASGGPHLLAIVAAFEARHVACDVEVVELPFADRLGPLRRGEVELIATRLPIAQPDIVVGPVLAREPRVLAVARDHPLAQRSSVTLEHVAEFEVMRADMLPKELAQALVPSRSPSGREIRRRRAPPRDMSELLTLIARGKIVHPTVPSFAAMFAHPGITYLPLTGMPRSRSALAWRRRDSDPRLRAFLSVAREVLRRPSSA